MTRLLTFLLFVVLALVGLTVFVPAQERPYRQMRQWQLGVLEWHDGGDAYWATRTRVDVFDTEGVCLYVIRGYASGAEQWGASSAIAAVPKTQLPKGAGCQ